MKLPKIDLDPPEAGAKDAPRKSIWTTVLTATPVMLTVLATVLAGLSNSEMTLAQYHRSLAAQHQSKAADQWNLFQAKRIRGTSLQMTIDLLRSREATNLEPAALEQTAEKLVAGLDRASKQAEPIRQILKQPGSPAGTDSPALKQAIVIFLGVLGDLQKRGEKLSRDIKQEMSKQEVQTGLACLTSNELPQVSTKALPDAKVQEAVLAIRGHENEDQTQTMIGPIPDPAVAQAIQVAEANVQAVEKAGEPFGDALNRVEAQVREQSNIATSLARSVRNLQGVLAELPETTPGELHAAAAKLQATGAELKAAAAEATDEFQAARYGLTIRRYQREADSNQKAAEVYEVQVRKNSFNSERHRQRSKHFFYGMLAAQAGVTIATFSLALKHRNLFWGLASLTGVGAVLFALYVYLYT